MQIDHIDHFVLTVRSIEATCAFYSKVLGMEVIPLGATRKALRFGSQKINLHEVGKEAEPKAAHPGPGTGDFCLVTTIPMAEVLAHLEACGVALVLPPVRASGAVGPMESVYFRDPDGNLVEVSNYLDAGG